jgi:cell division ATPase FtsA
MPDKNPLGYIGFDYGTSGSYLAKLIVDEPSLDPDPVSPNSDPQRKTIPTCLLRGKEDKLASAYGHRAYMQWQDCPNVRAASDFHLGFKPEILQSTTAASDTEDFFRLLCHDLRGMVNGQLDDYLVVIGVPSGDDRAFEQKIRSLAKTAGFDRVDCVAEPLGALAHHISKGEVSPADARDGVLVIDFGGGTFDVAVMDKSGARSQAADLYLGGRLFDDLFLRWIMEQNQREEVPTDCELFVWQSECKRLKEAFSDAWAKAKASKKTNSETQHDNVDVNAKFHLHISFDSRVWPFVGSIAEFEERARQYKPTGIAERHLNQKTITYLSSKATPDGAVNLYKWITDVLSRLATDRFAHVIMTGGSCQWPFMDDLLSKVLMDVHATLINKPVKSKEPDKAIGNGLALIPKLRADYKQLVTLLNEAKGKKAAEFGESLDELLKKHVNTLSNKCIDAVWAVVVQRHIHKWWKTGGILQTVKTTIENDIKSSAYLKKTCQQTNTDFLTTVEKKMRNMVLEFIKYNGLPVKTACNPAVQQLLSSGNCASTSIASGFGNVAGVTTAIAVLVVGAVGTAIAAIAFKVSLLLFVAAAHNPFVLGGAIVVFFIVTGGAKVLSQSWVENCDFQGNTLKLLNLAIGERKLTKILGAAETDARNKLKSELQKIFDLDAQLIKKEFGTLLDEVIKDLGVFDQAGSPPAGASVRV